MDQKTVEKKVDKEVESMFENFSNDFEKWMKRTIKEKVNAALDKVNFQNLFEDATSKYADLFAAAADDAGFTASKTDEEVTLEDFVEL